MSKQMSSDEQTSPQQPAQNSPDRPTQRARSSWEQPGTCQTSIEQLKLVLIRPGRYTRAQASSAPNSIEQPHDSLDQCRFAKKVVRSNLGLSQLRFPRSEHLRLAQTYVAKKPRVTQDSQSAPRQSTLTSPRTPRIAQANERMRADEPRAA